MPGLKRWGFFTPPAAVFYSGTTLSMGGKSTIKGNSGLTKVAVLRAALVASCILGALPGRNRVRSNCKMQLQLGGTRLQSTCERSV